MCNSLVSQYLYYVDVDFDATSPRRDCGLKDEHKRRSAVTPSPPTNYRNDRSPLPGRRGRTPSLHDCSAPKSQKGLVLCGVRLIHRRHRLLRHLRPRPFLARFPRPTIEHVLPASFPDSRKKVPDTTDCAHFLADPTMVYVFTPTESVQ